MTLASLIAGGFLAAAPDAPALGTEPELLPHLSRSRPPVHALRPLGLHATAASPAPPRAVGLFLLGGAAAIAGLALTVPAVTHRGCALSGRCPDGSQALAAGGLFLLGAGLLAAVDAPSPQGGSARVAGLSGAELRARFGLDVPLGAPGPGRTTLRWSPFRLSRGGGVRVGLAF
jgi:hypothetical protein